MSAKLALIINAGNDEHKHCSFSVKPVSTTNILQENEPGHFNVGIWGLRISFCTFTVLYPTSCLMQNSFWLIVGGTEPFVWTSDKMTCMHLFFNMGGEGKFCHYWFQYLDFLKEQFTGQDMICGRYFRPPLPPLTQGSSGRLQGHCRSARQVQHYYH